MSRDIDMLQEVRKALRDIRATLTDPEGTTKRAIFEVDSLRAMLDTPAELQEGWAYYQVRVANQFTL